MNPEWVWIKPTSEKQEVGGMIVGTDSKESNVGLVVKVGAKAKEYFVGHGFDFCEGAEIVHEFNRSVPVEIGGDKFRAVHYQNIQAFSLKGSE